MRFCARAKAHFIGALAHFSRFSGFALQKGPISAVRGRGNLPHGEARASLSGSAGCMARTSAFQRVFCHTMRRRTERCPAGRWIFAARLKNLRKFMIFMIPFGIPFNIVSPLQLPLARAPSERRAFKGSPGPGGAGRGKWWMAFHFSALLRGFRHPPPRRAPAGVAWME